MEKKRDEKICLYKYIFLKIIFPFCSLASHERLFNVSFTCVKVYIYAFFTRSDSAKRNNTIISKKKRFFLKGLIRHECIYYKCK